MRRMVLFVALLSSGLLAATRQHAVAFGKYSTVKLPLEDDGSDPIAVKIRPLLVDAHSKEFTFGPVHEITEQTFVVQGIFRVNDSLPGEAAAHWRWERGGWLLVNTSSGKVQPVLLPQFDADDSAVAWFRDYAAYCAVSDDGKKLFAVVAQIGRRKPVLKKEVAETAGSAIERCEMPIWQRSPSRVTFSTPKQQKFTFVTRSRTMDLSADQVESAEEGTSSPQ